MHLECESKSHEVAQQLKQWIHLSLELEGYGQAHGYRIDLGACYGDTGDSEWTCPNISITQPHSHHAARATCPMNSQFNGEVAVGGLCQITIKDNPS